jgi:anti-sigma regulatory factor (Ser/Thr protein kinase)
VNAVVHGNANDSSRHVKVRIYDEGETCRVCVHDEGKGFDVNAVEMADCTQLGGRGVCLIKEFMEDVRFNAKTKCLEMTFNRQTFTQACA